MTTLRDAAKDVLRLYDDVGLQCDNGVDDGQGHSEGAVWLHRVMEALRAALAEEAAAGESRRCKLCKGTGKVPSYSGTAQVDCYHCEPAPPAGGEEPHE